MLEAGLPGNASDGGGSGRFRVYLSYRRQVRNSVALGSVLFYGGMLAGVAMLLAGGGWVVTMASCAAALGGGYFFAQVRLEQIDKELRSRGFFPEEHWRLL